MRRSKSQFSIAAFVTASFLLPAGFMFLVTDAKNCIDPSSCLRDKCTDKFDNAPPECHNHADVMNCFRTCKNHPEVIKCYEDAKANNSEADCYMKYSRKLLDNNKIDNPGLLCREKCLTKPTYWNCIQKCDDTGCFTSFRECENSTTNVISPQNPGKRSLKRVCQQDESGNLVVDEDCMFCYTTKLMLAARNASLNDNCLVRENPQNALATHPICVFGEEFKEGDNYTATDAYKWITECVNEFQATPPPAPTKLGTHHIEECYKMRLMKSQIEACTRDTFTTVCTRKRDNLECQLNCLDVLVKPLCYVPCKEETLHCERQCHAWWPNFDCLCPEPKVVSTYLKNVTKRLKEYEAFFKSCSGSNSDPKNVTLCLFEKLFLNPFSNTTEWNHKAIRGIHCKSKRFLLNFAEKLGIKYTDSLGTLANHLTYYEAYTLHCAKLYEAADAHQCVQEYFNREEKDVNFMNKLCDGTDLYSDPVSNFQATFIDLFRSEIFLWCMRKLNNGYVWSFEKFSTLTSSEYVTLLQCETDIRDGETKRQGFDEKAFLEFARIVYELEEKWCLDCETEFSNPDVIHPYTKDQARCEYSLCYANLTHSSVCEPLKNTETVLRIALAAECSFKIDYSLSTDPYRIWNTYFDEIPPLDKTHQLVKPDATQYLSKSSIGAGKGHYVFPYFLVLRPFCEDGLYTDEVYKFISSGVSPIVKIKYLPTTSREKVVDLLVATFQGTLVNLLRTTEQDKAYIPLNPNDQGKGGEETLSSSTGCYKNLCYPAYLIPHILVNIPIFEVEVPNQQTMTKAEYRGYTNNLHLRDVSGKGSLKIADNLRRPTASDFFPQRKIQVYEDTQFLELWKRLPDNGRRSSGTVGTNVGPELEHISDHNCKRYEKRSDENPFDGNPFFPLDSEDFFPIHYTAGSAPQAVIAGFYNPNLVIIGDPDMKKFELVRWDFEVTSGNKDRPSPNLFYKGYPCFSQHYNVRKHPKPMYSMADRLDPEYWLQFYRMRYLPQDYLEVSKTKGIFAALSLEDRFLFVTTSGLVTFYGNMNLTSNEGKAWEVEDEDRLKKCFKIVRGARRAHPKGDTIVAITYSYLANITTRYANGSTSSKVDDISQEVWVGRYEGDAKPITWRHIGSELANQNLQEEEHFSGEENQKRGSLGPLDVPKLLGQPVDRRETNPKSQIEAICYKAYRSNMGGGGAQKNIELLEDEGWCDAIDATPVTAKENSIQILVRMKAYYSGGELNSGGTPKPRSAFFYVIASLNTDLNVGQSWQINSIIPRIPCQDEHEEAIPSVVQYRSTYFRSGSADIIKGDYGCHSDPKNAVPDNTIYLHGMTYTRSYNHHLFLYGNRLLQSTDGGETFVLLTSFPQKTKGEYKCEGGGGDSDPKSKVPKEARTYHRIKLMAFDDLGHYAFLTSKRELWYGNIGSLVQIRLRPSAMYSGVVTRVYAAPGMTDAVPFSLFFDSNNNLYEMVALIDRNGKVSQIARRLQSENTLMRGNYFVKKVQLKTEENFSNLKSKKDNLITASPEEKILTPDLLKDVTFDPLTWSTFCPFASPSYRHNFSAKHGRSHSFFLPPPRQHPSLGDTYQKTALYAYQAVTFNLIWNTFFNNQRRDQSEGGMDPFETWPKQTRDASVLGRLAYMNNDPVEHGLLVLSQKYVRSFIPESESERIFLTYYMDYGVVMKLTLEYSVTNDFSLNRLDYYSHHLDTILLNVDNANGTLIQINTEKDRFPARAAVRYTIIMSVKKDSGLPQTYSGRDEIQVPIKLHLIGGFGNCIISNAQGLDGDTIATLVQVGCPPSRELVFDWNTTLYSIQFRDISAHYGGQASDCFRNEQFCFFARYPMKLYFNVFDAPKKLSYDYNGNYTMRVIAGGYDKNNLIEFSTEQIQAFNIPGVSDISLIWNEWDLEKKENIKRSADYVKTGGRNDSRELVLTSGKSAIQLGCHTLSPCARILTTGIQSVYYLKVFISNRGVDSNTLCLYEKELTILLYGFPPSPEIQFTFTLIFYLGIMAILYLGFFCLRNHSKVWRSSTLRVRGWFLVIKETFPKTWLKRFEPAEEETELDAQRRKDDIIMSLQGHLNVPRLVPKHVKAEEQVEENEATSKHKLEVLERDAEAQNDLSVRSFKSSDDESRKLIIEHVQSGANPVTWSEVVYEHVISSRLTAILDRNKQLADRLKASNEANS